MLMRQKKQKLITEAKNYYNISSRSFIPVDYELIELVELETSNHIHTPSYELEKEEMPANSTSTKPAEKNSQIFHVLDLNGIGDKFSIKQEIYHRHQKITIR